MKFLDEEFETMEDDEEFEALETFTELTSREMRKESGARHSHYEIEDLDVQEEFEVLNWAISLF